MPKTLRKLALAICALTLFTVCLSGQTVSSSLEGTVLDPAERSSAERSGRIDRDGNGRHAKCDNRQYGSVPLPGFSAGNLFGERPRHGI